MRLAVIATYSFVRGQNRFILALFLFFFITPLTAQKYKLIFTQRPLSEALLDVSKAVNIKVAYDAEKLSTIMITNEVKGETPEEFMTNLLQGSGFHYQLKHDHYLIIAGEILHEQKDYQLTGSVTDKESGEQLPFATVNFRNQNSNTVTSTNGTFSLPKSGPDLVHITVSYIGYYPIDTVLQPSTLMTIHDFKLKRKYEAVDTITIKSSNPDIISLRNDVDFATTINPIKLIDFPTLSETDIFKSLQLLPGINYSENSSELSIRGGSGDQNLILYDGQTLYTLSHYFGVFSSVNPNIIKDVQIYKGGYDSRYGERVSGIVDITGKSGSQASPIIYGDLNLISGNIAAEVPVNKKITLVAAYRRSYSDIYATDLAKSSFSNKTVVHSKNDVEIINQTEPSFHFYDYNAKLTYRPDTKTSFSIGLFGGRDSYDNPYGSNYSNLNIATKEKDRWGNNGLNLSWQKQWNNSLYTNVQAGNSSYFSESTNATSVEQTSSSGNNPYLPDPTNDFNTSNDNKLGDASLSLRNTLELKNNHKLNFGLLTRRNSIYYHKDADNIYVYDNTNQTAWTTSAYVQEYIPLFHHLIIKPGLRFNFYSGNQKGYIEPRFAANYKFNDRFSIRMATGRYHQFISQVTSQEETSYDKNFWILANGSVNPVLTADHFIVGSTVERGNFLFDIEAYYKQYSGLEEYMYISQFRRDVDFEDYFSRKQKSVQASGSKTPSYFINGKGQSYGTDLMVSYKHKNFSSWVSYSLSKSLQQFSAINNNEKFPSPADRTHQLSWANLMTMGKWNFGTVTLFSTGAPYATSLQNSLALPLTRTYTRLPNYFRNDISINYNIRVQRTQLKVGTTFINIFNNHNYFDVNSRKFDFQNASFSQTNLIRSQNFSLNFFVHFLID
jgi:ferric enterobactin receptor